jgi:PKD repeat protein
MKNCQIFSHHNPSQLVRRGKTWMTALLLPALMVSCTKESDGKLEGTASEAAFTYTVSPVQDTLPFSLTVRFNNTSTDAFAYQWDFGDGSALSTQTSPVHTYARGDRYTVRLTSVGRNGNTTVGQQVVVSDACSVDAFAKLTGCSSREWTWSLDGDAIAIFSPDGSQLYFSGSPAACQADDTYRFFNTGRMEYNANGSTFVANEGPAPYSCQAPANNATSFRMVARANQTPQLLLPNNVVGGRLPFVGTTDPVAGNKYDIVTVNDDQLILRGVLGDGALLVMKFRPVRALSLNEVRQLLTGGSSKTWLLDGAPDARAITVGTEDAPTQFFAGGTLADCQLDDEYTFTSTDQITYNANGSTFVAGPFQCLEDRSYNNIAYTFSAVVTGNAGIAQVQLPVNPALFVGITDRAPENTYRILEISQTRMVLRAGNGLNGGVVHTMKLVAK